MAKPSQPDQVFRKVTIAAEEAIKEFPRLGLSIEFDKRGKHPAMMIRVMPAIKIMDKSNRAKPTPKE